MKIIGAKVFEKEGRFSERDLFASGQRICRESETDGEEAIDARGLYAVPMLVDIHFHGCAGHDLCEGTHAALAAMARYQA